MATADTVQTATLQAFPELLSLPPIAVENILRSASFSSAIAACSCRALRDAWRELTSRNPEFAATALVDRFQTVDAAAEHLYNPEPALLGVPLVERNIAAPVPGLLDAVFSPMLSILSTLLKRRSQVPVLGYLTATGASDAYALRLLRHLVSLREGAQRKANDAVISQASSGGIVENGNQDGAVASQEQAEPLPSSVFTGAAFAGHAATVVELLKYGADPFYPMLPGAVRAGNARLCAALLEGGRMAGAACEWSAAAGGDVLGIRGNPSGSVGSYAGSEKATLHMASIYFWTLQLTYIGGGGGSSSGSGSSSSSSSSARGSTRGSNGGTNNVCAGRVSARGLLQRAVGVWCSGGAGPVQPGEDVAAALAAARAAAEEAADTVLSDSSPLLPLLVQSSAASAAAAAHAATAAALAALTPPEASCVGGSSSSSESSSSGGNGGSTAHTPGPVRAFLSSTTNHAAVRQLLLQWRPAEWQGPPQLVRAAGLECAAAVGAWPVVSDLLRAGVDPRDGGAPATLLYLALVQGRGAMAAWLLVRLLEHPAGVWREIVGAATAALVTRIMGRASPLQLLLRYKRMSLEVVLRRIGYSVAQLHVLNVIPHMLLSGVSAHLPNLVFLVWKVYILLRDD